MLASSIVNQIRQDLQNDEGLAYFYCDYKDSQKQDPAKLLATVLVMLAKQSQGVFENLQTFFLDQSAGLPTFTADFDTLAENFPKFVHGQFKTIYLIVDAMDETNPAAWDNLSHSLRSLHEQCGELSILVTSRNELAISRAFHGLSRTSIEQSDVASDIMSFITAELSNRIAEKKLKLRNPDLQNVIRDSLAKGSGGMFQWVRCQIESLCKLRNDNAIRAALFNLPRTLQDTYHRLLQRIEDCHPDDLETFRRVLSWLVHGVRDLTLDELAEAISIDPESHLSSMDFGAVDTDPEDVLGILGGLVMVSAEKIVSLAHYSVKEFLMSEEVRSTKPTFWISSYDAERDLAAVCLAYLCYDDFKKPLLPDIGAFEGRLNGYKFLAYATMAWPSHVKGSGKEGCPAQDVLDLAMRFLSSTKGVRKNYWSWEEVNRQQKADYLAWKYQRPAPLICAAWHGLSDAVRHLVSEEDATNNMTAAFEIAVLNGHGLTVEVFLAHHRQLAAEADGSADERLTTRSTLNLERALFTAASRGHDGIVEMLVQEGADVDGRVIKDRNALHVAALEGHAQTVDLLLRHGANHRIPCKRYGTPLAAAAERGHIKAVEVLLEAGANVNGRGGWYSSPLVSAIMSRNIDIIDLLIEVGADIHPVLGRHRHPLWAAASQGLCDVVRDLVNRGVSIKGSEALYAAAFFGKLAAVKALLSLGADPDECGGKYRTPLGAASAEGHLAVVRRLIKAGANVQYSDARMGNALHIAASRGRSACVRVLVKAGLDPFDSGGEKGSALVCAASFGHADTIATIFKLMLAFLASTSLAQTSGQRASSIGRSIVGALIAAALGGHDEAVDRVAQKNWFKHLDIIGPMPNSKLSCTPLEAAAAGGHLDTVKILLEMGADPTFANGGAFGTALVASIDGENSSLEVIEALLEAGCDANVVVAESCNSVGFPLLMAIRSNRIDVVQLLLANNADVNLHRGSLNTALQEAIWQKNTQIIDLLLERKADVNIVTEPFANWRNEPASWKPGYDLTALQSAAWQGNDQVVRRLIALGARLSVNVDDVPFTSALQIAAYCGHLSTLKVLIECGSNVQEARCVYYATALHCAAYAGHVDCARTLLLAGAKVNETGPENRMSPLAAACCRISPNTEIISLLVEHGAKVNARENDPVPFALHTACEVQAAPKVVELLLDLGADVNAIGGKFGTALQVACFCGSYDTVALLLRRGADPNIRADTLCTPLQVAYGEGHGEIIDQLYEYGALNSYLCGKAGSVMGAAITNWSNYDDAPADRICQLVTKHRFDVNLPYGRYGNALQHSIYANCADAFDCILAAGAVVNTVSGYFGTALTAAAWRGNTHMLEALLSRGALASLGNARFPNASFGAIWGNENKILQQLIARGTDIVKPVSSVFGTALQLACSLGHLRIVKTLVRAGAPINTPPCGAYGSPLQAMISSRNEDGIRYLLRRGADVSARGGKFGSPLHAAAIQDFPDIVELLLEKGADINATGGRYHTALQTACNAQREWTVRLLVERGANVNLRGGIFKTALSAAAVNGWGWAVRYLLGKGAEWSVVDRKIPKCSKRLDRADEILREALERGVVVEDPGSPGDEGEGSDEWKNKRMLFLLRSYDMKPKFPPLRLPKGSEDEDTEQEDTGEEEEEEEEEDGQEDDAERGEGLLQLNVESIPGFAEPWRKRSW